MADSLRMNAVKKVMEDFGYTIHDLSSLASKLDELRQGELLTSDQLLAEGVIAVEKGPHGRFEFWRAARAETTSEVGRLSQTLDREIVLKRALETLEDELATPKQQRAAIRNIAQDFEKGGTYEHYQLDERPSREIFGEISASLDRGDVQTARTFMRRLRYEGRGRIREAPRAAA